MEKKYYYFFIDDVIWALRDLSREKPDSVFDNPFFKALKTANEKYGMKTQLNIFYRTDYYYGMDEFTLADVPDTYKAEFEEASDWLKFAFHAKQEFPDYPHVNASYDDIRTLFEMIKKEVFRFAGKNSFAYGIVPHWLPVSREGCKALYDCGGKIMSATIGTKTPYNGDAASLPYGHAGRLLQNRKKETMLFTRNTKDLSIVKSICGYNHINDISFDSNVRTLKYIKDEETGMCFKRTCDGVVLNLFTNEELKEELSTRLNDTLVGIGNHEQYFYEDYFAYQSEYAEKIYTAAKLMYESNHEPIFLEQLVELTLPQAGKTLES